MHLTETLGKMMEAMHSTNEHVKRLDRALGAPTASPGTTLALANGPSGPQGEDQHAIEEFENVGGSLVYKGTSDAVFALEDDVDPADAELRRRADEQTREADEILLTLQGGATRVVGDDDERWDAHSDESDDSDEAARWLATPAAPVVARKWTTRRPEFACGAPSAWAVEQELRRLEGPPAQGTAAESARDGFGLLRLRLFTCLRLRCGFSLTRLLRWWLLVS